MLNQLRRSLEQQTEPVTHLVGIDEAREGPQTVRNRLGFAAETEWLLPVDDDDLLDPDCAATLLAHSRDADIVYSFCRMDGRTDWNPSQLFSAKRLFRQNFIPVTALIRRDLFLMLHGYRKVPLEDWDLYRRAYQHGARFRCVPEVLWSYRFHDGNNYQKAA